MKKLLLFINRNNLNVQIAAIIIHSEFVVIWVQENNIPMIIFSVIMIVFSIKNIQKYAK